MFRHAATGCADNILFVSIWEDSAGRGKIYALEGDTGNSIWDYTFNDTGAFAAVIANGVVYVGGWRDARIYAFNPSTGDTIATFPGLQNYYIVSDGKLIAGGGSNDVHILSMEPVGIEGGGRTEPPLPHTFTLKQNYPNPFNPSTTISFDIPEALSINKKVNLVVYDMRGRLVRTLIDTELEPGTHKIHWDGRDDQGESVASGIYMYRLKSGDETLTRKMTVMK